jgi:DNA-binding HxlR family transcriptional regulator
MGARKPPAVDHIVENCLGCKWTLKVIARIRAGVVRPGRIERSIPGLTTKVLSERLKKLTRFDMIVKREFREIPPRVEYRLTSFGRRLVGILDSVERLRDDVVRGKLRRWESES